MLLLFFILHTFGIFSYADDIDSLKNLIANTSKEKELIDLYFKLADRYDLKENPKEYYLATKEALRLAESIEDDRAMGNANKRLGNYFFQNQEIDFASNHFHIALDIFREIGDRKAASEIIFEISSILFNSSNYSEALRYANEAHEILKEINDRNNLAKVHSLLCDIYSYMGVNELAIEHCIQSLQLFDELNQSEGKANLLNSSPTSLRG